MGTPSLEFAAEVAGMLLVGGILANAAHKTAAEFLKRANEHYDLLSREGTFFSEEQILNAHIPNPNAWSAFANETEHQISVEQLWKFERELLLQKYNKTTKDIVDGKIKVNKRPRYVHNGDEFINVATDIGYISVRWSQVAAYRPSHE